MDSKTVGVLGGGQLGRMMAEAAHRLGVKLRCLDPEGALSPAGQIAELAVEGSFKDPNKIRELASLCDVVTMEIEHVGCDVLEELEKEGVRVEPSSKTVRTIQDKYLQKQHMAKHHIAIGDFMDTPTEADARNAGASFGYPFMLKAKKEAYDGKGNAVVSSEEALPDAWKQLGGKALYAEKWVPYLKELAVMVVRSDSGETAVYPLVDAVQLNNVCHTTLAPAIVEPHAAAAAQAMAAKAVASLWGAGIFGVEMFLLEGGTVLLNEVAPRPHNTGHYTYEACECDQFENHLRAILGLPLGGTALRVGASMMLNVLGDPSGSMEATSGLMKKALSIPGAAIHWYGKAEARAGRKMAHITFTANSMAELQARVAPYGLLQEPGAVGPSVGIIMGSDSDLPAMQAAADVLENFGVAYEVTIVSAHRTPARLFTYSQTAHSRGIRCIIAGAGGAAHLPGMCAAMTPLPVIGVPIKTSTLNGVDSLHSIVQMPRGVPVATVAIGNAMNAGLLAVRMLGMSDPSLLTKMSKFMAEQEKEVLDKADKMEALGWRTYLAQKSDKNQTVGI